MYAYIINLARSAERRAHITAELEKARIDYEFVAGVDGRHLDCDDAKIVDPAIVDTNWFRPGVAGCALSHLRVHQKILADRRDVAMVLEDDVTVPPDLSKLADDVAGHLTGGAEVALLNYDGLEILQMSQAGAVRLPAGRLLALPIDISKPESGAAYVITREACQRMSDNVLPVRSKADDWKRFYHDGMLDRVRCVVPMAVTKDPAFASTMEYNARSSLKARALAVIERYNLRPLEAAVVYRRRLIWRKISRVELVNAPFIDMPSRIIDKPSRTGLRPAAGRRAVAGSRPRLEPDVFAASCRPALYCSRSQRSRRQLRSGAEGAAAVLPVRGG